MKIKGVNNEFHPGITMHKIPVQAGFPGLVFTIGMLAVFLVGIPGLIYFLLFAIVLGIVFAVMLRFIPREAGVVAFLCSAAMAVFLVGIPTLEDWRRGAEMDLEHPDTLVPVAFSPPTQYGPLAFQCDCHQRQSKQPCDRTIQRDQGQKKPGPPSAFDGTWEGKMNDLPGVNLIVADAGGGQIGGVVTFYLQFLLTILSQQRVKDLPIEVIPNTRPIDSRETDYVFQDVHELHTQLWRNVVIFVHISFLC